MMRWTCSTTLAGACSPAPTGPAPRERLADLSGLDLAAQGSATALTTGPVRPAGQRPAGGGTRSAARCPASSLPPPCRWTGAAEQPGVATGSWGAAKSPDNIDRGIGRSCRAIQAPRRTRQRLLAVRHQTYPAWHPEGPAVSNSGGYLGERRWRWPAPKISPTPVSVLPARGRVVSTRDPTRVRTRPISGSTRTPNSHRRSRMDRNMSGGYPTSHPSHPSPPEPAGLRVLRSPPPPSRARRGRPPWWWSAAAPGAYSLVTT